MAEYIYYAGSAVYFIISALLLLSLWKKKIIAFPATAPVFEKPLGFKTIFISFFLYIAVILLVGIFFKVGDATYYFPYLNYEQIFSLTLPCSAILSILLFILLLKQLPKDSRQKIWGEKKFSAFVKGVIVSIAFTSLISLFVFCLSLFFEEPFEDQLLVSLLKNLTTVPWLFILTALTASILIPLSEEILFRGFLQNALVSKWGVKSGIIATSVVFSLFHYTPSLGPTNLEVMGATFILSLAMGILYIRERSLLANIGLHMWNNGFAMLVVAIEAL